MKQVLASFFGKSLLLFLCMHLIFSPTLASAKFFHSAVAPPPSNALPVMSSGQTSTGWSRTQDDENHYLQIDQSAPKVVIKWDSFDIGSDAHVHFEQGEGVALNRIFDSDPSRIFGQLTATGSIYLESERDDVWRKFPGESAYACGKFPEYSGCGF
ncbi:MAG: filamentous hemagglutinin N-terminal domain-containing protein [Proteobacteria bacterium]|nr:filamentous hemagglutinin N-terminal domain-containing protein [Pseudomonadota bacterium]